MVYVPGLLPNPRSHGKSGAIYTSRREVRERPRVSFPWGDRVKSLGLSRELADELLESFATRGLRVHDNHPVRDRVRKGRGVEYVPAVLRYNSVPAKVLLEVCNLANDEDRRLLQTQAYRQRVAEAIVDGVLRYYGYPERRRARQIVASSGG
jgi:N-acetylmuramoyl-L-alanine amidase